MYINIYPYDRNTIEMVDALNFHINQYSQCTRYIDLVLGDGLLFNNLDKQFNKYLLNDYVRSRLNFYKLLKTQIPEYLLNECEYIWNTYDTGDLLPMYTKEKDPYRKCMEHYILENKSADKELQLEYFPKSDLEKVMIKLKSNDILLTVEKIIDTVHGTSINDLIFINLDLISEQYHTKVIKSCMHYSNGVLVMYSSIGSKYLDLLKYWEVKERINGTGYIFVLDNELPGSFYAVQDA